MYLYDSLTTPVRVKDVSENFAILSEHQELTRDVEVLVSAARAYALLKDSYYLEEFDKQGIAVVTKGIEIYNRDSSGAGKDALRQIVELTEAYTTRYRNEFIPLLESGQAGYMEYYRDRCEPLAAELLDVAGTSLSALQDETWHNISLATGMENSTRTFTVFLAVVELLLLAYGVSQVFRPLLVKYNRLGQFAGLAGEALVVVDRRGIVTGVNPAAENLLQVKAGDINGVPLEQALVRFPLLQGLLAPLPDVALKGKAVVNNQVVVNSESQKYLLKVDYHPLFYAGRLSGALMVAYPLEIQRDKRYLFDAIEAERKKISIEIHDWVGRNMSAIIHALDFILKSGGQKVPGDLYQDLVRLRSRCQAAAMDMRGIMNDIHPYLIDRVGLLAALESYAGRFEQLHGIKVYLYYHNRALSLGKNEEIIVYRIIQEALANVIKHSSAGEVDIYFRESDGSLQVEITDNGTPPEDLVMGNGLWGMKERANLIGGDLVYQSGPNGFTLTLTVPAAAGGDNDE